MANVQITYARFYPIKKGEIPSELVNWIISDIDDDLKGWKKFFYLHPQNAYFDVLLTSKSILNFYIFHAARILDHFHIWLRISDEGGKNDLLAFRSNHYALEKLHLYSDSTLKHYGADEWNYVNMCLYTADAFSIHMKQFDEETIKKFTNGNHRDLDFSRQADESWKMPLSMVYYKTSYLFSDKLDAGSAAYSQDKDLYSVFFGDGEVYHLLYGNSRFRLNEYFISNYFNEEYDHQRIDENILQICLWKNDRLVHEWKWDDQSEEWKEKCAVGWDHCADPEYLRFLTLYENSSI